MRYWLLLLSIFLITPCMGEGNIFYRFRIHLKSKGVNTEYSINNPTKFLSAQAIKRRVRQNIRITESDFPISASYKNELIQTGGKLITESRWLSTVVLEYADSSLIHKAKQLPFVDSTQLVWKGEHKNWTGQNENSPLVTKKSPVKNPYGYAWKQIDMLKGNKLHKKGFKGKNIQIAVIDAGFIGADRIRAFSSTKIIGTHNIVYPDKTVYASDAHGTKVLSCLAAQIPHVIIGTAPEASFWLIKSEDSESEYPIEEDYWTAAAEFADSVGVDIITSSLGYFAFDDESFNYTHEDLNGEKAFISRAARIASEKGILVFSSAGNEGSNPNWEKITVPADAKGILTVGAVTDKRRKSSFSSIGLTADNRTKPDVSAMGSSCCVINENGEISFANGTSFSTPILAGVGACLWQALPQLSAKEIRELICKYASQYSMPDNELGYGIPDMYKSYKRGLIYVKRQK